jgi:hypothetical protein
LDDRILKKNKNENNSGIYGPFVRKDKNDKWHWDKSCPHYPKVNNPEIKITSVQPNETELCPTCLNRAI